MSAMRIQVAFRSANGRFVVASLMLLGYAALANAAPPKVTSFFPAGVARGSQVKITAAGEFSPWPVQAVASHAGLKIEPAKESGHLTIEAAADCPPGLHYVRLFNAEGAAAQRRPRGRIHG